MFKDEQDDFSEKLVLWKKSERRGNSLNASRLKKFKLCLMVPFSFTWSVFVERFCEKLTREVDLREECSVVQMTRVSWLQGCEITIQRLYGIYISGELHLQNVNSEWF